VANVVTADQVVEQGRHGSYSRRVGVSGQQGAVPVLEGDGRGRPSFALVESKLRAPWARPGIVARPRLVERLLAAGSVPLVCVVAPAGYGKTTLLTQWGRSKGDRVGWVSLDARDNDPVVLLTYLAVALDRIEPVDPGVFRALASPGVSVLTAAVPRLASAVAAMSEPVTLVLDQVESLDDQRCLDAVAELALALPAGSQLALAARRPPALPVALLRASGRVVEVGAAELAMDDREAAGLLEEAGVKPSSPEVPELVKRAEGWPVGLYLAALAVQAGGSQPSAGAGFSGEDRFMADYLRSELLAQLPTEQVEFLTRTAVLERMCGPLCDAVLAGTGSGAVLGAMEDANLLLVPLDRRRRWYRYHQLLRELLLAELERREPELIPQLHTRAADWYEANDQPEAAIDHAKGAGDPDRVARLVSEAAPRAYASGRRDTAIWWYDWFEDQGLMERYPMIAIQGAMRHGLLGQPAGAERWTAAAERAAASAKPAERGIVEVMLAVLHAGLCRHGIERMRADARFARERVEPGSTLAGPALHLEGASYLLAGDLDRADALLARSVAVATESREMNAASYALAQRSLVAIRREDWDAAGTFAEQALTVVRDGHLDDYVTSPLVYAVVARTALHRGDVAGAKAHLARAAPLRPLLTYIYPTYAVPALLELAHTYFALNDVAGARAALRQAGDVLRLRPDLGTLPAQVQELRSRLDRGDAAAPGSSSLTTAELRLLPLLATHLSFTEIGQRLFLSKHTIKTQAISIYRKLGASSRSEAVQRVQEVGLLGS
jgi:LuxR family transcriptional regulator, maltose regulon positive regulatory protein